MKPTRFFLSFFAAIVLLASCGPDDICKVSCQNGGVCQQNGCICPTGYRGVHCEHIGCPFGYEGVRCETISRNKFVGYWAAFEDGTIAAPAQYPVTIEAKSIAGVDDPVYVSILNFNSIFSKSVYAYVVGDTMIIPVQEYEGKKLVGRGICKTSTAYGVYGVIEVRYQVTDLATHQVDDYGYDTVTYPGSKLSEWIK